MSQELQVTVNSGILRDPLTGPTPMTSGQQKLDLMCYLRKKKKRKKSYEFGRGGRVEVDAGGLGNGGK